MKQKFLHVGKYALALIVFVLVFALLQTIMVPVYLDDSTASVKGYYALPENDVDVLFLGASEMICGINPVMLAGKYDIKSYDFGASSQYPQITEYYLREALKTQNPRLVVVEVSTAFWNIEDIKPEDVSWSYAPTKMCGDKYDSLYSALGDRWDAFQYCYLPLLKYHSRWAEVRPTDIAYLLDDKTCETRGQLIRTEAQEQEIAFDAENEGEKCSVPQESMDAYKAMAERCREQGIEIVFIKVPTPNWTRTQSAAVKEFMTENGLEYLELNEYTDEIGIDPKTDFFNDSHLNSAGADKTTEFIAAYINNKEY